MVTKRFRCTSEEEELFEALAEYLEMTFSDLAREAIKEKRARLVESGRKPPLKTKNRPM